jgi:hypothetical protein
MEMQTLLHKDCREGDLFCLFVKTMCIISLPYAFMVDITCMYSAAIIICMLPLLYALALFG